MYIAREEDDPKSVEEAFSSCEKGKWKTAMKKGIESLNKNDVSDIVELPEGCKAI